jgi:hypothetical protein
MFYNRHGKVVNNVVPNHQSRLPVVEFKSQKAKPLLLKLSRLLIPSERYNLLIGRGGELGLIAIQWDPMGDYQVKMKPNVCELRLAAFRGMRNAQYQSAFKIGRTVLVVELPSARHELERWWYRVPTVSDNPGDRLRKLSSMHQV